MLGATDLFILSVLDKVAFRYFLYWRYFWFDMVMHLIGGVAIGCLSSWAYFEQNKALPNKKLKLSNLLIFNLSFAVLIGFVWELFELWAERVAVLGQFDSFKDIFFGTIGSLLAGIIIGQIVLWRKHKNSSQRNEQVLH